MKTTYALLVLLLSHLAIASNPTGVKIATITNKSTGEKIIYGIDKDKAYFYLKDFNIIKKLNTLEITDSLSITPDERDRFKITKSLITASGKAYHWCWDNDPSVQVDSKLGPNAIIGVYAAFIGGFASMAVCAVGPATPAFLAAPLIPVDGAITLGKYVFSTQEIAERKFNKLLRGVSTKANKKVFKYLKMKIINL